MRNMTARAEAKAAGAKTYETGVPCRQGHLAPRATVSGSCVECVKVASRRWLEQHEGKAAAYTAAYRERNAEAVREKDRQAKRVLRAEAPERIREVNGRAYARKVAAAGREVRPFNRMPVAEVVARLQEVHKGALQYLGGYQTMTKNAEFFCVEHRLVASATPHNVLRGATPCPKCNHMRSAAEDALFRLLAAKTQAVQRDRTLLKPRELDILLPIAKVAVEYCGMYWHSHGDAAAERANKHRHYEKYTACAAAGVRLLTVFETEWLARPLAVQRLLRSAVGKMRGRVMARKCELRKVPTGEARVFFDRYHVQGAGGGVDGRGAGGEHYGLYWKNKLVACMRFALGVNDRGAAAKRVWTLARYATRVNVVGGASRLFQAFLADVKPTTVKSFSDNRLFAGGMYAKLGFTLEEELPPDYQVWSPKVGLLPKAQYQRRLLAKRQKDHGLSPDFDPTTDLRTEAEVTYAMGARRIYDCGKKRWVWSAPVAE